MWHFTHRAILLAAALCVVGNAGCAPAGYYDPKVRREQLLELYPPRQASREDVHKRWGQTQPVFTAFRPAGGWAAEFTVANRRSGSDSADPPAVRKYVAASEGRTGKSVQSLECYVGVEGYGFFTFTLCYCWFYYDASDKIVDAEWQYHSD